MPTIAAEFGVGTTAAASSITLTLLLRLLGGVTAGAAADRFGRKWPLMLSILGFALCDGAVAFAPSFAWVLVLRTLFGFAMGAEWTAGSTLVMENWPARSRGIVSGLLQGSWAVGYLLAGVVAAWVVPRWGWRALFLLAALPALLVIPIRLWVPESPDFARPEERRAGTTWSDLLQPRLWQRALWATLVLACGFGAYYALTSLYPTLLQQELGLSRGSVAGLVGLFNVGMLVGAVACGALATRYGVIRAMALPALALLPVLPLYVGLIPGGLWLGALLTGTLAAGVSGITPLLLATLFPAEVRARFTGLVYHAGAFVAALVPTAVAALSEFGGARLAWAILIFAGTCKLLTLGVLLLRPKALPTLQGPPHS